MSCTPGRETRAPDRVEAQAPTRVDFAGGTIDIWPLHLLHPLPLTVNAAIDLYARVTIESRPAGGIEITSRDRKRALHAESPSRLAALLVDAPPDLELVLRLVAHFLAPDALDPGARRTGSCSILTDCAAPAGSGLGGSSSLGIALVCALAAYTGREIGTDRLLHLTRAIETQVLRIPTGEQDYHAALHGGALGLHYTVEGTRVERLPLDLEMLEQRTVLIDSGMSRSSGISNWDMVKRHLDGDRDVREALEGVNRAAHAMRRALLDGRWDDAGAALAEEWEARKRLSPAVTDPSIDELIAAGRSAGALAGKVCGAGGGGCLVFWVREGCCDAVRDRLAGLGARILGARYTAAGVGVTVA
jgi:D-glycero-alpha-D-manno-heptose-7-phosphate kinase